MSKYLIESTASCIRAETNAVTDILSTINCYKETEIADYKNRIVLEENDVEKFTGDLIEWTIQEENLAYSFLDQERDGIRMVLISDCVFADHFKDKIVPEFDSLSVIKATIGVHDMRFQNTVVLALERDCSMGKGYTVLRAWTNLQFPQSIAILKVD